MSLVKYGTTVEQEWLFDLLSNISNNVEAAP
jgi:hypothetical protein